MTRHQPTGHWRLGLALALTTALVWGVLPLALKIVVRRLDAATLVWFRFGVATMALGGWLATRGRLPSLGRLGRHGWMLLAVAVLGLAFNFYTFTVGLDMTTPGNAQVLVQLGPLLLALGSVLVFGERYQRLQWAGLATLAVGLLVFFSSQLRLLVAEVDRYLVGSGMLVAAAATWAAYGLAQKQLLRTLNVQGIMLCIYAGCFLCFTPGATPSRVAELPAWELGVLLFCAANTLIGYGAFASALHHWQATRVSAVLALTPLATLGFTLLAAALLPGIVEPEAVSAWNVAGAATVVVGSLLVAAGARPPHAAEALLEAEAASGSVAGAGSGAGRRRRAPLSERA